VCQVRRLYVNARVLGGAVTHAPDSGGIAGVRRGRREFGVLLRELWAEKEAAVAAAAAATAAAEAAAEAERRLVAEEEALGAELYGTEPGAGRAALLAARAELDKMFAQFSAGAAVQVLFDCEMGRRKRDSERGVGASERGIGASERWKGTGQGSAGDSGKAGVM
jgi:hypothetical protein